MGLKSFNPYTASRRFMTVLDKSHITKQTPEKSLLEPKKRSGGRNNQGEIVIWHRGGGHKKQYRTIDFRRDKTGVPAKVASIEYDPNRSANIALLALRGWRQALHPASGRSRSRRHRFNRRERGHPSWQRLEDSQHSSRHYGAQPRTVSWPRRPGGSHRGRCGSACSAKKVIWLSSRCLPAKFASFRWIAWRRSARSAISTTKMKPMARLAARVGGARSRLFVAWP